MKYIIAILFVSDTIQVNLQPDLSFKTYNECLMFQRYMNMSTPVNSNTVFWCVKKKWDIMNIGSIVMTVLFLWFIFKGEPDIFDNVQRAAFKATASVAK